jgi:RNA polymerase sigma-54 factor
MSPIMTYSQALSQSLFVSPQLQQALKLLQCSQQELGEMVDRELLENPTLERSEGEEPKESSNENSEEPKSEDRFRDLSRDGGDFREPIGNRGGDNELDLIGAIPQSITLRSHLNSQTSLLDLSAKEYDAVTIIIESLDDRGYLDIPLSELSEVFSLPIALAERGLEIVQSLEPAGMGARSLKECLLLQLKAKGQDEGLAGRLLTRYQDHLEQAKFQEIARAEGISVDGVMKAIKILQKCNAAPGYAFLSDAADQVVPDMQFKKVGAEYVVIMNDAAFPQLRVNGPYADLAKTLGSRNSDSAYIKERLRAAKWFIKCVEQRRQTLSKVASCIMRHQTSFLEKGPEAINPLILREIAEEVGIHESTVSRAIANKYVETDWGLFSLRWFFMRRIATTSTNVTTISIKVRIKSLIAAETNALSDSEIAAILKGEGIVLARRTIAKYRGSLGIKTASERSAAAAETVRMAS